MSENLEYVEKRLNQWADWCLRGNDYGLGFPKKTMEAKLKDGGGIWVKVTGEKPLPSNPQAEHIESLIKELAQLRKYLALVVSMQYLTQGIPKQKAKKIELSYSRYYTYLALAKHWLDGRLRAK